MSLANLSSPTAVRKAMAECDSLGREQFLAKHGFGEAREYMLRHEGKNYDSKAIAGVAHKYQFPDLGALEARDFSGGVTGGAAAKKLHGLGFEIVGMSAQKGWGLWECEQTVSGYLQCLADQSDGKALNKAAAYRTLAAKLNGRTPKSVEYKFQNIEKILEEENLPRLGMSTKANYQNLLRVVVLDRVGAKPQAVSHVPKSLPPLKNWEDLITDPPKQRANRTNPADLGGRARNKVAVNDALNRALGRRGEEYVLRCEQERLRKIGRTDLATRVKWVSEDDDGLGYDILSYDEQGQEIYVEVKTTNAGHQSRFFITDNELAVARRCGSAYKLYRLFDFGRDVRLYVLFGPLDDKLELTPKSFTAKCKG
jgi:hypothetical protein